MNAATREKLLFALALLLVPSAAQGKPQVAVDFDIEATKYKRNLYKEVGAVEGTLEESLARIGSGKFGFLAWKPGHSNPDRSAFSATLQARMVDGIPGKLGSSVWLKLSARPEAAKTFDCGNKRPGAARFEHIGAVPLFSGSEPQSGKAEDLRERVERVLLHHFGNGGFGQTFSNAFLNRIPICDKVIPFPGSFQKHVAIGIAQDELRLDSRTRMALLPCSQFPGEPQQVLGEIGLELAKNKVFAKEIASLVQVKVVSCDFYPWEGEACIQSVPLILQHRLSEGIDVFMRQYVGVFEGTDGQRTTAAGKG